MKLLVCLLPLWLFGNIAALTETHPQFLVGGQVSAINGAFGYNRGDIVVKGAEPIHIPRLYISSCHRETFGGWVGFSHYVAHKYKNKIVCTQPNGTRLLFKKSSQAPAAGQPQLFVMYGADKEEGFTNSSYLKSGARSNPQKKVAYLENGDSYFKVCSPDGSEMKYERYGYCNRPFLRMAGFSSILSGLRDRDGDAYFLTEETLANGNHIKYTYDLNSINQIFSGGLIDRWKLKSIETTDGTNTKKYARADFYWEGSHLRIKASDGQEVKAYLPTLEDSNPRLYNKLKKPHINLCEYECSSSLPQDYYLYHIDKKISDPLLGRISRPKGQAIYVDYYRKAAGGRHRLPNGEEYTLSEDGFETGKVASLEYSIGNNVTRWRYIFKYHKCDNHLRTEVLEPDGSKTDYISDSLQLPKEIRRYDRQGNCMYSEAFTIKGGMIKAHTKKDGDGKKVWTCEFSYDGKGNVVKEVFAQEGLKAVTTRKYNERDLLVEERAPSGLITHYLYDQDTPQLKAKLVCVSNQIKRRTFFVYDGDNLLMEQIEDDGASTNMFDTRGASQRLITHIKRKESGSFVGMPIEYWYGYFDFNARRVKQLKRIVQEYDDHGLVTKRHVFDGNDCFRYELVDEYNEKEQKVRSRNAVGDVEEFKYDGLGNVVFHKGAHGVSEMEYDIRNRMVSKDETSYEYDERLYLVKETTFGKSIRYERDEQGKPTLIAHPGGQKRYRYTCDNPTQVIDEDGNRTITDYNGRSQPTRIMHPNGLEERFTYDERGNKIQHTRGNCITDYTYDAFDRVICKRQGDFEERWEYGVHLNRYVDAAGYATVYEYNGAGQKVREEREGRVKEYKYDALGRLWKEICGERVALSLYDDLDRCIEKRIEDTGGKVYEKVAYKYDALGNRVAVVKENGSERTRYDEKGRIVLYIDGLDNETKTEYDDANRRKIITDPLGRKRIETCDGCDRITCVQRLDAQGDEIARCTFEYNQAGCTKCTDTIYSKEGVRKQVTRWEYNKGYESAIIEEDRTTYKEYTLTGKLAKETKNGVSLIYSYDQYDRVSELMASDFSVHYKYRYDPLGRLTRVDDQVNETTSEWEWDAHGLVGETLANGYTIKNTYDAMGRRIYLDLPSGRVHYSYDPAHLTSLSFKGYTHSYAYDLDGNVVNHTCIDGQQLSVQIDRCGRTVAIDHPEFSQALVFDDVGNVLKSVQDGKEESYTYDVYDQLDGYGFDSNYRGADQRDDASYTFDALDRLIHVKVGDIEERYTYDALGRRMTNGEVRYLYDGNNEIGTEDALRILGSKDPSSAIIVELDGEVYAPLHDLFGNLKVLVGGPVNTFEPFGPLETSTPWSYCSKREDRSGLIYFGARYYHPGLKRFLSPDPKGFIDGSNRYQFAKNNPFRFTDLYGESAFSRRPRYICYGQSEHPDLRIMAINGMNNTFREVDARAEFLSKLHGGAKVHQIFQPHTNIPLEAFKTAMSYLGFRSKPGKLLKKKMRRLFKEMGPDGRLLIYAHSKGSSVLERELRRLSPKYRNMIEVHTFGAPKPLSTRLARYVTNHVDRLDPIAMPYLIANRLMHPFTSRKHRAFLSDSNVRYTPRSTGHCFLGGAYERDCKELAYRYQDYVR